MKISLASLIFFLTGVLCAQSYVSSGIRHFDAQEYPEALRDFREAENSKQLFTKDAVAKTYFYLGMTLYRIESNSNMEVDIIKSIINYFNKALAMDSVWSATTSDVISELNLVVLDKAKNQNKKASKELETSSFVTAKEEYINLLDLSYTMKSKPEIELWKAQAYHEIGDMFFQNNTDVISLDNAGKYYQRAIRWYEVARYNDPFSKEIVKSVLSLAKRTDDPERIEEYTKLLKLAGG